MLLSAVSVLVVAQSSSEFLEGLMNKPVFSRFLSKVHELISSALLAIVTSSRFWDLLSFYFTLPKTAPFKKSYIISNTYYHRKQKILRTNACFSRLNVQNLAIRILIMPGM